MGAVATEISRVDSGYYSRESVEKLAAGGAGILAKYDADIRRYAGDVPRGFVGVRSWHESSGSTTSKTSCCGEVGLLQVWMGADWEKGRDAQSGRPGRSCQLARSAFDPYVPAENLWCGLRFWNNVARRLKLAYPLLFPVAGPEFWGSTLVALALGEGALKALIKKASPTPGRVLTDIVEWVRIMGDRLESAGIPGVGAAATARRVIVTPRWVAAAAQLSGSVSSGFGVSNVPFSGVPYTGESGSAGGIVELALFGGALWLLKDKL